MEWEPTTIAGVMVGAEITGDPEEEIVHQIWGDIMVRLINFPIAMVGGSVNAGTIG